MKYFNEIQNKFHQTAFYVAVEKGDIDMAKVLMANDKVDVNIPFIFDDIYI